MTTCGVRVLMGRFEVSKAANNEFNENENYMVCF